MISAWSKLLCIKLAELTERGGAAVVLQCRCGGATSTSFVLFTFSHIISVLTFNISVEVQDLGWEMLKKLYLQAVDIAKKITKQDTEEIAVNQFTKYLNATEMYFNENPFPENESNEEAFRKCKSEEGR